MKSAVDEDDAGWGLGIPEKMKNNANWVDITHEFKGACKGTGCARGCACGSYVCSYKSTDVFLLFSFLVLVLDSCRAEPWRVAS